MRIELLELHGIDFGNGRTHGALHRAPAVPKRPVNSQAHPFRTDLKNSKYVKK